MKLTLMETASQLVLELSELTGISLDSIKKDDETVLALFQTGTDVNKNTGLDMIPMFETGFAKRTLAAVQPESYEEVRKIRAFVNDGSPWAHTTLEMLENGLITLKSVLADQADLQEFARENGISEEDLMNTITDRNVMSREAAEQFADITWKLAFFKIHCEELYYISYKEKMAEFYF